MNLSSAIDAIEAAVGILPATAKDAVTDIVSQVASAATSAATASAPAPSALDRPKLEAEHRELLTIYGDAQARLRSLAKFVADVEAKLDQSEALFARLVASEQASQKQGPA
jgi:hypothetical protein